MERLNYDVLKRSGYKGYILENAPEKILQFGEGNFLRAFVCPTSARAGTARPSSCSR